MSKTKGRLQILSNSGFERKAKSDATIQTYLHKFHYFAANIDILHSMIKVFTNINEQSGRVKEKLKDKWYREFTFTQVKLHAATCLDALLELYAMVEGGTFLVSTMNFAKVFKQLIKSVATFYGDIAVANQNHGMHDLNAYITSRYEESQSNVVSFNEEFEKFKKDAYIHLPKCARRSGFDIDMHRESARPFFQLPKLKSEEVAESNSNARNTSARKCYVENPVEARNKSFAINVIVKNTSFNPKDHLTNNKHSDHNQKTTCSKDSLSAICKSSKTSNSTASLSDKKMDLECSSLVLNSNGRLGREIPTQSNSRTLNASPRNPRQATYSRSKVEDFANQFYSLLLKRNAESKASILRFDRILNNGYKIVSPIRNQNSSASQTAASNSNSENTSSFCKRQKQNEFETIASPSHKKRVKWSL